LFLFGLALLIRLVFCFASGLEFFSNDSYGYIETARILLTTGKLGSFWPPGYPIFIAGIYSTFGESPRALIVFNCLLGAATVSIIFLIARIVVSEVMLNGNVSSVSTRPNNNRTFYFFRWIRVIQEKPGFILPWIAALALVFHPNVLNYTRQILSDTLAATMLTAAVYFALKGRTGLAGLFMGLCLITRPSALFITPVIIVLCVIRVSSEQKWRAIATNILMLLLIVLPVSINASLQAKRFCIVSNNGQINIFQALGIDPEGYKIEWQAIVVKANFPAKPEETAFHYYFRFASAQPKRFIMQRLLSLYQFFGPWPLRARPIWKKTVFAIFRIPMYILAILAAVWLFRNHRWDLLLAMVGPTAGLALMHTVLYSTTRHIVMIEPLLMVLVALGVIIPIVYLKASHKHLAANSEEG